METKVSAAFDEGGDVLRIEGEIDGRPVQARGWVSALERHYPATAYDAQGNRRENERGEALVNPRAMTPAQRLAYCRALLEEQNREEQPAGEAPRDLRISDG